MILNRLDNLISNFENSNFNMVDDDDDNDNDD